MFCHTCSRGSNSRLPFYCPTCARNHLYLLRYEHAQLLLQKEVYGQQIENTVTDRVADNKDSTSSQIPKSVEQYEDKPSRFTIQAIKSRGLQSASRTQETLKHVQILKEEIQMGKDEITRRRSVLSQRRSDARSVNYRLVERRTAESNTVQEDIKERQDYWDVTHKKIAASRVLLCREAASLYRLRQKSRRKDGQITSVVTIGGLPIIDLRDMNSASASHLSTIFSHMCHLLILVSHYLSLRLPAEITLAHRNYPLCTIFSPSASYVPHDNRFPGQSPTQSPITSPTTSRTKSTTLPRPRPLFVSRSLPKLAKEDPAAYTRFLEGATLLAWNISWVCRTQGISAGLDSWEGVCDIGGNLWRLLVAPPTQTSARARMVSVRDSDPKYAHRDSPGPGIRRSGSFSLLGYYSHGTAHSFLGGFEGTEFMKTWKLPSHIKVMDKVKSALLGELASAEWEILEEKEWEDEDAAQDQTRGENQSADITPKISTENPSRNSTLDMLKDSPRQDGEYGRSKGTSGWTKLKNR